MIRFFKQVSMCKSLGFNVDEKLHWNNRTKGTKPEAKRLYFVRKLSQFKVYKTLIAFVMSLFLKVCYVSVLLVGKGTVLVGTDDN